MASIIKFPRSLDFPAPRAARPRIAPKYLEGIRGQAIFSGLVEGIWVAIVLVWPVLKWVLS
ncbi:KleE stable inheritance protein, partial [Accumulibacter sp.]|uniref:KleE stable inheritance protein n=1 Tax=Accumulibacter sp. TaxID=2053492 RepID=UPI0028C470F9